MARSDLDRVSLLFASYLRPTNHVAGGGDLYVRTRWTQHKLQLEVNCEQISILRNPSEIWREFCWVEHLSRGTADQ